MYAPGPRSSSDRFPADLARVGPITTACLTFGRRDAIQAVGTVSAKCFDLGNGMETHFFLLFRVTSCGELDMSESDVGKLVTSIEMEMFDIFRNTDSKYMNKYRTIMFNLKDPKNKVCKNNLPMFRLII